MARRRNKAGEAVFGALVVLGSIAWLIAKALDAVGAVAVFGVFFLLPVVFVFIKYVQKQKRLQYLRDKYRNEEIVQRIMNRLFWQGQTAEQLRDSVGTPLTVDNKVMATRKREVWKYNSIGRRRYALRITLDDDVVIGWDQKN